MDIPLLCDNCSLPDSMGADGIPVANLQLPNGSKSYHPVAKNVLLQYSAVALVTGGCIPFFYRVFYGSPMERDGRCPADAGHHSVYREVVGRIPGG